MLFVLFLVGICLMDSVNSMQEFKRYIKKVPNYIFILFILYLFGINIMGGIIQKQIGDSPILTERQKSILRYVGLPEDYESLNMLQQFSIKRIEIMFKYLDYKYDEEFKYIGYIQPGINDTEELVVYPGWGTELDSVSVKKTSKGFTDNYMEVAIRGDFESYIRDFFVENYNIKNIKIYSTIDKTTITNLDEEIIFDNNVKSTNNIYIDENDISHSEYENMIEEFHNWLKIHNLYSVNKIYILKSGLIDELTGYNENEYGKKEQCEAKFSVYEYLDD